MSKELIVNRSNESISKLVFRSISQKSQTLDDLMVSFSSQKRSTIRGRLSELKKQGLIIKHGEKFEITSVGLDQKNA